MLALQITSMKPFMNQLLAGDTFDLFLLEEATISTANTYTIDGHINTDFYSPEERNNNLIPYDFQPWSEIKGLCFHLIKGKNTPLYFKFVLHLKPEKVAEMLSLDNHAQQLSQLRALVLTIKYHGSKAVLTTATAYNTFVPGKEIDMAWDKALSKYLSEKGIAIEQL